MIDPKTHERWTKINYSDLKEKYNMRVYSVFNSQAQDLGLPSRFWIGNKDNDPKAQAIKDRGIKVNPNDASVPVGLKIYICRYYVGGRQKLKAKLG